MYFYKKEYFQLLNDIFIVLLVWENRHVNISAPFFSPYVSFVLPRSYFSVSPASFSQTSSCFPNALFFEPSCPFLFDFDDLAW